MSNAANLQNLLTRFAARPVSSSPDTELPQLMQKLIDSGFASLPMPGQGLTLERWRTLAAVAASDLALVKLFEGHTDAMAIMAELEPDDPMPAGVWGTWAAEPHFARVNIMDRQGDRVYLHGAKPGVPARQCLTGRCSRPGMNSIDRNWSPWICGNPPSAEWTMPGRQLAWPVRPALMWRSKVRWDVVSGCPASMWIGPGFGRAVEG